MRTSPISAQPRKQGRPRPGGKQAKRSPWQCSRFGNRPICHSDFPFSTVEPSALPPAHFSRRPPPPPRRSVLPIVRSPPHHHSLISVHHPPIHFQSSPPISHPGTCKRNPAALALPCLPAYLPARTLPDLAIRLAAGSDLPSLSIPTHPSVPSRPDHASGHEPVRTVNPSRPSHITRTRRALDLQARPGYVVPYMCLRTTTAAAL